MVAKKDGRSLIKSTFPGHDLLIDRAYEENQSFKELCQDYRGCAVALERWRRMNDAEPSSRVREYTELMKALTNEIESWLGALQHGEMLVRRGNVQ